jgi:hypothetical protein
MHARARAARFRLALPHVVLLSDVPFFACSCFLFCPPPSAGSVAEADCGTFTCGANAFLKPGGYQAADCVTCDATTTLGAQPGNTAKCLCKPGFGSFNPLTGTCAPCASGQWANGQPDAVCAACGTGTSGSNQQAVGTLAANSFCICQPGFGGPATYTANQPYTCAQCLAGQCEQHTSAVEHNGRAVAMGG